MGKDVKIGIGVALCIGLLLFVFLVIRGGNPEKPVVPAAPTPAAGPSAPGTGLPSVGSATPPKPAAAQQVGGKWTTLQELELVEPDAAAQERTAQVEITGVPPKPPTAGGTTTSGVKPEPSVPTVTTTPPVGRATSTSAVTPSVEVTSAAATTQTYTTQKGDTLWSLAARFYSDGRRWKKIYEANRDILTSSSDVPVGAVLVIPPADSQPSAAEEQAAAAPQPTASVAGMRTYTVERGDTLYSIARKQYGDASLWRVIYEANREQIPAPDQLPVGTVLAIPPASEK